MSLRLLNILASVAALFGGWTQSVAQAPPSSDETRRAIVILVSLDGFRWDYVDRYTPPHLARLAAEGVRAVRMRPAFPSSTFPNHYTLVTGLYPGNHGIIGNRFLEPATGLSFNYGAPRPAADAFWGGEPVWVTAERQGVISASVFWPGSEAEIGGHRPRHWLPYKQDQLISDRVGQVLAWLALPEAERPRVISVYFHHADTAGHVFGIDSEPLRETVNALDGAIGDLRAGIEKLGLADRSHLVIVSDHGMAAVDPQRVRALDDWIDLTHEAKVSFFGPVTGLWPVAPLTADDIVAKLATLPSDFHAYRREDLPEHWKLAAQPRVPPVVIVAEPGAKLMPRASLGPNQRMEAATHGYDETVDDMAATFIAWGPHYRCGVSLPNIRSVDVYELLCATVGLNPASNDGDKTFAKAVMREIAGR